MKTNTIVRVTQSSAALVLLLITIVAQADESEELAVPEPEASQLEFFERRIRPVLVGHCYSCHATDAKDVKGGLLLDSREGLLMGGDSGPALVAGKPKDSLLLAAMRHESLEMPPDRKLPDNVLKDFEIWIENGAADPRTGGVVRRKHSLDVDQGREFWSFRPVVEPPIPATGDGWGLNAIDQFVAAARGHGQTPSTDGAIPDPLSQPDVSRGVAGDAPPLVLIRRLTFVLTGLPPTLSEQQEFAELWAADPESAMVTTVDRLLASPHFGERWGRHWLDVARYAESTGGGRSMMLPDAWRFRDYVIRSFNADKPFDQLIREHLAGDLLPFSSDEQHDEQITGAGYLMLGAINYEEQDKEHLRMDVVDEQIDSMGRTFLGMTLGCCRCHDHKFDPIPATDYYALAGIFRSTKSLTPGNVCGFVTAPLKAGFDKAAMDQWLAQDAELEKQIAQLKKGLGNSGQRTEVPVRGDLPGIVVDDADADLDGEWIFSKYQQPFLGMGYHQSGQPRTGISARYEAMLPEDGEYVVRMVINHADSRSDNVPVLVTHVDGESLVTVSQKVKPPGDGVFAELGRFRFEKAQPASVVVKAAEAAPGFVIVDAVQFLPAALMPSLAATATSPAADRQEGHQQRLKQLEEARKAHAKTKPEVPVAMCVEDESQPADWHLHIRGEIRNLGPVVPRGFITVATPPNAAVTLAELTSASTSGRKELADWVASPANPLTARVYVNRVWRHVMGEGLVRTPDNFGETGERPSHPELLDFLAATFMEDDDWSTKKLIRRLCLSRTFRMSSSGPQSEVLSDPDNRRLTRAFRRRLDAESVRDSLLSISGSLDQTIRSGRTIAKLATYDNEYHHAMYPTNARSVFVPFFRNTMLDLFEIFDGANPNLVSGMRTRSTRPAQALYMLNSPFVMEQAQLAARTFLASSAFDASRVDHSVQNAWRICVCREPTAQEFSAVQSVLAERPSAEEAWTEIYHALFASVDFRYLD